MTNEPVMDERYAVIVTRPGHDTARIGPIPWKHQADSMTANLNLQLHSTAHPEGTHIAAGIYAPALPHLPLLPIDAYALAELVHQEPDTSPEERFPDTYSRLLAQVGYDRSADLWHAACRLMDEPEESEEEPSEIEQLRAELAELRNRVAELERRGCNCPHRAVA